MHYKLFINVPYLIACQPVTSSWSVQIYIFFSPLRISPLICFFYDFVYCHSGLLFMASPIEDVLVYKTLEPSKSSFDDVAQNSYLGL